MKLFLQFIDEYGKGHRLKLFLMAFFSVFMGMFEFLGLALIFPFVLLLAGDNNFLNFPFLQKIIDTISQSYDIKSLALVMCLTIIFIYILKNIFMIFYTKYQNNVMAEWQYSIYCKILKNLLYCPYLKLNKIPFGDRGALLGSTLSASIWGFVHRVIMLLSSSIIAACILLFLFYKFTLPAVVTAIFLGVFVYLQQLFFKRRAKEYGAKLLELSKKSGSLFEYTMRGIKEIKISKNRDFFIESITENVKNTNHYSKLLASNGAYPIYVTEIGIIISFGILSGLIFCLQKTSSGFLVSSLAVVAAVVLRLAPILNKVQSSMFLINQARSSIVWFLEKSKQLNDWVQDEPQCEIIPFDKSIVLKDLNFSYDDNADSFSLKDINIEIKKGEFIGVVGLSGSGKTTLIDILSGLNTPTSGKFIVDNLEINKENVRGWHKRIAILPQDFFLMPLSILENVTFGDKKEEIDYDRVFSALKKAEIYDKIGHNIEDLNKSPDFSHGQKHRLALARAFYQNADVLFLDEATSSLDLETEDKVSKTISKLKGEKTVIAIAHRLSTLRECDALLYMKDGKILDKGTFKELKEKYPDFENMLELSTFNIS